MSDALRRLAVRWIEEVWNDRSAGTIDELLDPRGVWHFEGGDVEGVEAYKRLLAVFLGTFPDLRVEVESVASRGDEVAIRWRAGGTHAGDGLGLTATHQRVSFHGTTWQRYRGGKLVEGWIHWNQAALFQQLQQAAADRRRGQAGAGAAPGPPAVEPLGSDPPL